MKTLITVLFLFLVAVIAVPVLAQEDQHTSAAGSSGSAQTSTSTGATAAEPSGTTGTHTMSKHHHAGHMGSAFVKEVQQALKDKGNDPGPIDGKMGPKTKAAIKEFQKANSLTETGKVDKETADKLGVSSSKPAKS